MMMADYIRNVGSKMVETYFFYVELSTLSIELSTISGTIISETHCISLHNTDYF